MPDLVIRGATVVDGSGQPARVADIGVSGGRIVDIGQLGTGDAEVVDAAGLVAAPGFVDPHTHYDAQLFWDRHLTPSSQHGVTSVIAGNCGFTIAPVGPDGGDYLRRMLARVEGMPIAALEEGVDWSWESYPDYLDTVEQRGLGVNVGFMVGHSALRRYVMGDGVAAEAHPAQVEAMAALLDVSLAAGGLGLSTSRAPSHADGDGNPVPSRYASDDELLSLAEVVGRHEGTGLEAIVAGCTGTFSDEEIHLLGEMSRRADRPLNWNVLDVDSRRPDDLRRQLDASTMVAAMGGRLVPLTMPILVPMAMSFDTYCAIHLLQGWKEVMTLPTQERLAALRRPETRALLLTGAEGERIPGLRRLIDFGGYRIGDTFSAANHGLAGRAVQDIADERGRPAFDTLVDIVVHDGLRTVLWPTLPGDDDASWTLRRQVWTDDRVLLGGSDAGAHLDRMCGAPYVTTFLGDMIRGRRLLPLETAVRLITDAPARLFGLRDRGRLLPGALADIVLFDPETIGAGPPSFAADLPGHGARLTAASNGIARVYVNGIETIRDGSPTGTTPGRLLRSGRDTTGTAVSLVAARPRSS
ncbi:MAG: aminoacylase [Actinomycetia bacterium]|nr:aminoacylase [Actinomycetes bacterium]